jgi:cytochrome c oxidase subunit 3
MTALDPVELVPAGTVPVATATVRGRSVSWWGMLFTIGTESMVFAILLAAWFFLRAASKTWPPPGTELPELKLTIPFSVILWSSSIPVLFAEHGIRRGHIGRFRVGMAIAWVMGIAFVGYTIKDFNDLTFGWRDSAYGSAFYVIVGLHVIHVVIGLAMSAVVQLKAAAGRYDRGATGSAEAVAMYWHFVDGVWLAVMPSVFLATHIRQ